MSRALRNFLRPTSIFLPLGSATIRSARLHRFRPSKSESWRTTLLHERRIDQIRERGRDIRNVFFKSDLPRRYERYERRRRSIPASLGNVTKHQNYFARDRLAPAHAGRK